ncbi:hypothetical protein SERLA73DRAFT_118856 [Serpula lacrymans var. lacrymans S7.3]|uniref:Secreted protein n=1 Tax=Serpula lacrymans var. lacrymans (strain S7.3) TaxID=936435 RepID=F8PFK5_SERL3|nr:hypothetical protein SERLA73DRAFT_118856 [Serpula lacrymans var. lacrymans S7.3]
MAIIFTWNLTMIACFPSAVVSLANLLHGESFLCITNIGNWTTASSSIPDTYDSNHRPGILLQGYLSFGTGHANQFREVTFSLPDSSYCHP